MTDTVTEIDRIVAMNVRMKCVMTHTSYASVAQAIGMDPRLFRRRTRAETPWSLDDAVQTAQALGVTLGWLTTAHDHGTQTGAVHTITSTEET